MSCQHVARTILSSHLGSHLATVLLWYLLKVRLCSPLQHGNTSCRCVVRLPPTPSSSTSQSLHARIFPVSFSVHIYISSYSDYDYVQNPSKKYICLKKLLGVLRGGVGWGLGTLFAGQGDKPGLFRKITHYFEVKLHLHS